MTVMQACYMFLPSADVDYSAEVLDFVLENGGESTFSYEVRIIDDDIVEGAENFSVVLLVPDEVASRFSFQNQASMIEILDNDGKKMNCLLSCIFYA